MKQLFTLLVMLLLFIGCSKPLPVAIGASQKLYVQPTSFSEFPQWQEMNLSHALLSFTHSCQAPKQAPHIQEACLNLPNSNEPIHAFFESYFLPYIWYDPQDKPALITGYYEPLIEGSRTQSDVYTYPLHKPPSDMIHVKLDSLFPELKGKVVRGRLEGNSLVPYYTRAELTHRNEEVLCYVKDKVELFFLHIQGSGRIKLDTNETIYVGYADKNGHPYRSIGTYMIKNDIMPYHQMSLEGIKEWAQTHPLEIDEILNHNASYVFFEEKSQSATGAQGVMLTPRHSVAVDTRYIPLGTPILIATTLPKSQEPFHTLAIAQDKGAAITGSRRLDLFWGFGEDAYKLAASTKQNGTLVLLLPKTFSQQGN